MSSAQVHAMRLGTRSRFAIVLTSLIGIIAFAWPLLALALRTPVCSVQGERA
jgi:hypothetical protein